MRPFPRLLAGLALVLSCLRAGARDNDDVPPRLVSPTVVLAYDHSGAFGPQTPRTKTDGWQEAIDYCVKHKLDLDVKGGWGGRDAIYHVHETIRIPASQDFRIDGGLYVLNWEGPPEKDLLRIDSGMDCHFAFGILVYGGTGAALRVRPEHPVPIDNFPVFADSDVRASSIADPSPFTPGERHGGAGVVFDTEKAAIVHADFRFTAILNFATCIRMAVGDRDMAYCKVDCGHLHTNADRSLLLDVGRAAHQNIVHVRIGVDQGAKGVRGVEVSGAYNDLDIVTRGGFDKQRDLTFAKSATGDAARLITNRRPDEIVTDAATDPSNTLSWTGPPLPISVVSVAPGKFAYTRHLTPAMVRVTSAGSVEVTLRRATGLLPLEKAKSHEITLAVGDTIELVAKSGAVLHVIPQSGR